MKQTRKRSKKSYRMTRKAKKAFRINPSVYNDPRNILLYLSERGIPKVITEPKSAIIDAKLYLEDEDYMWGTELWETAKGWSKISNETLVELVKQALTKKYKERPSPPFSAAILKNITLKGNDGQYYTSVPSGKTYVWRPKMT